MVVAGIATIVGWAIIATAVLVMDNIGAGNFREQAKRDQQLYKERLNALSVERDTRAEEAHAAQARFNAALGPDFGHAVQNSWLPRRAATSSRPASA